MRGGRPRRHGERPAQALRHPVPDRRDVRRDWRPCIRLGKDPHADRFCQVVLALRSVEECYRFFEDVCTVGEFKAMAQRFEIARLFYTGHTDEDIVRRTHASSATISRVRRFLEYGADGYRLVLQRFGVRPRSGASVHA